MNCPIGIMICELWAAWPFEMGALGVKLMHSAKPVACSGCIKYGLQALMCTRNMQMSQRA